MRYVVGFVLVLTLVTSPLGVSAQGGQEVPAVELQVDQAGLEVVPSPLRTADGYTLEEMELRVQRAKIGVGISAVPIFVGTVLAMGTAFSGGLFSESTPEEAENERRTVIGATVVAGCGALSMIGTGILLGVRKRKLRELQEAHYGTPRRVQWDLARSRLVF